MAIFKPFEAVRPIESLAAKVAELPYDVLDSREAREIAKDNAYSFLHVDKAEIDLEEGIDVYSKAVYEKARDNLYSMIKDGVFLKEKKPCFYIYREIMNERAQTGIVGCASIDDYINNVIKKHENTVAAKEQDRINHVKYCNANTGPIFLTYRDNCDISLIIEKWTQKSPVYDFKTRDGISQVVWIIDDLDEVRHITELFKNIDSFYIADGHHRAASAVQVGKLKRKENPDFSGLEEFNFFLSVLFPASELCIMDYNRVVKDLNGLTLQEYIQLVSKSFEIEIKGEKPYKPSGKHTYGMYLDGNWYKLTAKEGTYDSSDPADRLDASILQNNLLKPILGIFDPRTDKRIDFIGGVRGIEVLQELVDGGMKVAFSMFPTSIEDLMEVADAGLVMPPKSTWFEPKLMSGLFVHLI